jgi:hypothetical protein
MTPSRNQTTLATAILATLCFTTPVVAQAPTPPAPQPCSARADYGPVATHIFYLKNIGQQQDANELLTVLRNITDPRDRLIMMPSQNAIIMSAPADHIAAAQRLIDDLDKSKKPYRVTYTIVELDGTKRIGDQHYSVVAVPGQRSLLKQGSRVPVAIAPTEKNSSNVTYLDVGMNFDTTVDESAAGLRLRAKVEQSSLAEEHSGIGPQDPIIRQALFEGSSVLTIGKLLTIGSLDIPGTTRRLEIQATAEPLTP